MRAFMTILTSLITVVTTLAADPVHWEFTAEDRPDGTVLVRLHAHVDEGWHIYGLWLPRNDGPLATEVRVQEDERYALKEVHEPRATEAVDVNFGMVVRYHSGETEFTAVIERLGDGPFKVTGEVEYMVCNDSTCLPPVAIPFAVPVPAPIK
ncbi:MAG: hypothetical protein H6595_08040 [Flavobacteriales bacterium]|nr:hypothetical protein [Flavobacteriales bacterium]MCB9167417.1 hypothetical protein [Flavobacteriales bacterium]